MKLFKPKTRQEELDECSDGITASIINRSLNPSEILEIHSKVTNNLISHLERKKSELLVVRKKTDNQYKKASFVLTAIRSSRDQLTTDK